MLNAHYQGMFETVGLQSMSRHRLAVVLGNDCGWSEQTKLLLWARLPLVLQESYCGEFFSLALVPWVHYIPVDFHLDTLARTLTWANAHPEDLDAIAANARAFADQVLTPPKIEKYFERLLLRYSKLVRYRADSDPAPGSVNASAFFAM